MEVNGIIAEYNPFHNGHFYQIETIKQKNPRSFIIVMLSGYFCQRGEPSVISLRAKAEMALTCGADIVLLLPAYAATGSAEIFAATATRLLAATGICNRLVFGAENDSLADLEEIAKFLIDQEAAMWTAIKPALREGRSYAAARQAFIAKHLGDAKSLLLQQPNQILAIEYLKAIYQYNLKLKPVLIKREGSSYGNTKIGSEKQASAMAIRTYLEQNDTVGLISPELIRTLANYMPEKALAVFLRELQQNAYLLPEMLADLYYLVLENAEKADTRYMDENILNRLKQETRFCKEHYVSIEQLVERVSHKQYPKTRIQRALLNLLLNIKEHDFSPAYLQVIGFSKNGRYALKKMQQYASLPLAMNFSDLSSILPKNALWQENLELRAARLWLNQAKQPINQLFDSPLIMR